MLSRAAWCACVSFDEGRPRFSLAWGFAHPLTLRGPCPLSSWKRGQVRIRQPVENLECGVCGWYSWWIERTPHPSPAALQHVGIDHGSTDVFVPQEFLHRTNIVAVL